MLNNPPELELADLAQGLPAITPSFGAALAEAGAICARTTRSFSGC